MAPIPSRAEITQATWIMRSHFVAVSMASRRAENVGLAIPLKKKKIYIYIYISNLRSLDVVSGHILDRRDGRILIFSNFFQVYEAYRMAVPSSKAYKLRHELQLQILNAGVCIISSSLVPLHLSTANTFILTYSNSILPKFVCFYTFF